MRAARLTRIPHGFVVHAQIVANGADDYWTRVDTHPHLEAHATLTLQSRTILCHRILQSQSRTHGPLWCLLHGERRTKKCNDAVARELVHCAFVAMYTRG